MTVASLMLFAPYFAGAWVNSRVWTRAHPEDSPVIQVDGIQLSLGRIPSGRHPSDYDALFDCVAELPVQAISTSYAQYLSLDLVPLTSEQLRVAAQRLEAMLQSGRPRSVLVFCALGYSRSAAVLCAWMLRKGAVDSVEAAAAIVRQARPWVVLKPDQLAQLQHMQIQQEQTS